ncbi:type II toxin-antitoxin system VapC family toxin [Candidatus Woesearchaeota archaeon]|nr:type II toxin-antitoxin system VapC family toxin [Candidatus Woesearchaeota archaeon]
MILALDSSILIDLEQNNKETVHRLQQIVEKHQSPACIPFIVYFELYYGTIDRIDKNKEKALHFLQKFPLLQPTQKTAKILAEMKKKYETEGTPFSLADIFIASQVKEHGLLLITKDKAFLKIKDIEKIIL